MVAEAVTESGASSIKDMARSWLIKSQMQGRADMSEVSAKIKAALADNCVQLKMSRR